MTTVAHKPHRDLADPKELLLGFLDYYRSVIIRKIQGLTGRRTAGQPPAVGLDGTGTAQPPGVHGAAVAALGVSRGAAPRSARRRGSGRALAHRARRHRR